MIVRIRAEEIQNRIPRSHVDVRGMIGLLRKTASDRSVHLHFFIDRIHDRLQGRSSCGIVKVDQRLFGSIRQFHRFIHAYDVLTDVVNRIRGGRGFR